MTEKPPIGLIPKNLWERERILDLLDVIHRYVSAGKTKEDCVGRWMDELYTMIQEARK